MRRRLTWLAVSTGVLLFVGWAWLAPSLGGGGGEVLVMASARGAESLPGGSLDLHSRAGGWSTLTTLGRASVPAAPHGTSLTPMIAASTCRPRTEMAAMTTSATRSVSSQRRTPAPAWGSSAAYAALTSRATVVWTAAPGTIRMM